MLNVDNAARELVARGLIDPQAVVDGALTVRCAARRNRNLRVDGPDGSSYLVKQPGDPATGAFATLRAEGAFATFCREEPAASAVARVMPRLALHDPERSLLAFELIADSVPLWSAPVEATCDLGRALGTLHGTFRQPGLADDPRLGWLPRGLPWAFQLHAPWPGLLADLSRAGWLVIQILQSQDGLADRIDHWRGRWRAEAVIHGDVKSDNIIIGPAPAPVRIVDWELVQVGDPAWDLAGVLQDALAYWTASMPLSAAITAEEMMAQARLPLDPLRARLRSLWHGYREAAGLSPDVADERLDRVVAFSAVRLIQSAYELSYEADSLDARAVVWLQVAANLLADPGRGRLHLYGLPPGLGLR
jgi:hypothetical protein